MRSNLLKILLSIISGFGGKSRLSVLIYHRVFTEPDPFRPLALTASEFRWQMNLASQNFNILTLSEAVSRLRSDDLPPRSLCITFDDGYADNYDVALPILREVGIPATFFIASGFLDGGLMWNDIVVESLRKIPDGNMDLSDYGLGVYVINSIEARRSAAHEILSKGKYLSPLKREAAVNAISARVGDVLPKNLMMTSSQVKKMVQAGMEIGAHTVNHPILSNISIEESEVEIRAGREQLEALIGQEIKVFAYPNGKAGKDYRLSDVDIVRKLGFEAAVSTDWGVSSTTTDKLQLPRFTPWDKDPSKFMFRLLRNYWH